MSGNFELVFPGEIEVQLFSIFPLLILLDFFKLNHYNPITTCQLRY